MYGKLFKQMYEGSLATAGWEALVTFQQFVILADRDGVVDMTPEAVSRLTTIPLAVIVKGIEQLEQPDKRSRTPDEDGRRITRLTDARDWGWRLTNYAHYRNLRSEEERREYQRQYWHTRKKLNTPQQDSTNSTHAVCSKQKAEAEAKSKNPSAGPKRTPPGELIDFDDFKTIYPKRAGDQGWTRAMRAAQARIREGATWDEILDGARRYKAFVRSSGKEGTEFVKQAATFLGPECHFREPWTLPPTKADIRYESNIETAADWAEGIANAAVR